MKNSKWNTDNTIAALSAPGNINTGMRAAYPIMAPVIIFFTVVGMALPVLPLQVHDVLGFGPCVVVIVAALISRLGAGRLADSKGAKYVVRLGRCLAVTGGLFYIASLFFLKSPTVSVLALLSSPCTVCQNPASWKLQQS